MDDSSFVKVMQALDLDYSRAILSTKHFGNSILALNQQLAGMKAIAMQAAKDINATFAQQLGSTAGSNTIVDQYGKPFATVQTEAKKAGAGIVQGIAPATKAAQQHGEAVKDVAKQYNMFGSEMQRRAGWFLSGSIWYGGIKAAKETVTTISEVEMGMTEIARVMEDSSFVFKDYRDELLKLGVDYGQSFGAVQDVALRWAQAGYNVADSLNLTKTSLLALNTAELDAATSTKAFVGIMAQWGMTAADLPLVLDKINKTADDYVVESSDLIDGLLKSSATAKQFGLTLEETISLLTVMKEATGATGKEIGNAFKSILSYTQRSGSINTFKSLGIDVFVDEAETQFKSAMDIFEQIAEKWEGSSSQIQDGFIAAAEEAGLLNDELVGMALNGETWNDVQARDLAQASGGVYRRTQFIALIQGLAKAMEVLLNMTNSANYSQVENAKAMDTLAKKYESLKASAESLAVAIGDAGLLEALKGIVDIGTGAIGLFNQMPKPIKDLAANFIVVTAAIQAFKAASKMLGLSEMITSIVNATKAQNILNKAIDVGAISMEEAAIIQKAWETGTQAAALSTNAAAAQTEVFGIALQGTTIKAAALKTLFGIGLPLVISGVVTLFTSLAQAQEEAKRRSDELISRIQQEQKELNSLKQEYSDAITSGDLTTESKERLKSIQDTLIETYGLEATALDLVNGKYEDQIKLIDEAAVRKAKTELAALGASPDKARTALSAIGSENVKVPGYDKALDNIVKSFDGASLTGPTSTLAKALMSDDQFYVQVTGTVEERRDLLNQLILSLREMPDKSDAIVKTIDALSSEFTKLDEFVIKNKDVLDKEKQATDIINSFTKGSEGETGGMPDVEPNIGDGVSAFLADLEGQGFNPDNIIKEYRNTLQSLLGANKITLGQYYSELKEIRSEMYGEFINKSSDELKVLSENEKYKDSISGFLSIEQELIDTKDRIKKEAEKPANEALKAELSLIDHKKRIGEMSTEQELSRLKELQTSYKMNDAERTDMIERIYETEDKLSKERFQNQLDYLDSQSHLGKISAREEIRLLKEVYDTYEADAKSRMSLAEKIFDKEKSLLEDKQKAEEDLAKKLKDIQDSTADYYKDELKKQQQAIKDAYDDRIKKIKEVADLEKEAHQDRIKEIDDEIESRDRDEEERDYGLKMKDLQDDLAYWSVRTSREAREKIADIQEQIAEEEHDREFDLTKQGLEDEKETLQDKIDAIDEASKKEIEKWEVAYEEIEAAFDDHAIDVIATAGAMAEGAYEQWVQKYFNPLMESLSSGTAAGTTVMAMLGHKDVENNNVYQLASSIVDFKRQYEQEGNTFAHDQAKLYYQQLSDVSPSAADELQKMNYEQAKQYLSGLSGLSASVTVTPPKLSVNVGSPSQPTTTAPTGNKTEINIHGSLLNIEENHMEDDVDGEIVARQIKRALVNIK